jgi:hypothetical protein
LLLILGVFVVFLSVDFIGHDILPIAQLKGAKAGFAFALIGLIIKALLSLIKSASNTANNESQSKDSFEMKALTYVTASPDEVAAALIDEKVRQQWDLSIKSIEKKGDDLIFVQYANTEGQTS